MQTILSVHKNSKFRQKSSLCKHNTSLTLHIEHHTVCDLFVSVRHDAGELLFVGLAAGNHHKVAPYCDRPVLVARFLESGFTLQPGVPFDHARRFPVG